MIPTARCELCGEPMPPGEEMFKYHGYSGDCPKPPLSQPQQCKRCSGVGKIAIGETGAISCEPVWDACPICNGTGKIN